MRSLRACCAQARYRCTFQLSPLHSAAFNSKLWSQQSDIEHCSDGACCQMRPDHLLYGQPGLTALMNQSPCNTTGGCGAAKWAAGHLRTNALVSYGTWSVVARIAHSPGGGPTPPFAFTCFGGYVGSPAHNEISMCWEGSSQGTLGAAFWYSNAEHKTSLPLGFDASLDFHNYTVSWTPSAIQWGVDGKVLHTDTGAAGKTIPWEPMALTVIIRPRELAYSGDAELSIRSFSYTSA